MTTIEIDPAREVLNQAPPLQPLNLFDADPPEQAAQGTCTLPPAAQAYALVSVTASLQTPRNERSDRLLGHFERACCQ